MVTDRVPPSSLASRLGGSPRRPVPGRPFEKPRRSHTAAGADDASTFSAARHRHFPLAVAAITVARRSASLLQHEEGRKRNGIALEDRQRERQSMQMTRISEKYS